jgi:hypothetical protein
VSGTARRSPLEPLALFAASLAGSAALWGRLWVTSPSTRGICGCGDPSLFEWFLAWPEHAVATGHSLVFSRDLFAPHGINLLSNTSVLSLGLPLAPVTWWKGPLLSENLALLLAVPVAVCAMDLFLHRVTTSVPARLVLSAVYGFSPYVIVSLAVGHLMTAWVGILPLIALGIVDSVAADPRRSRRGQVLLCVAIVVQFFLGTELLLLAAIAALLALIALCATWCASSTVPKPNLRAAVRLAWPLATAAVLLVAPTLYALRGPRALTGKVWGPTFTPSRNGTSLAALVRPDSSPRAMLAISGYSGAPPLNLQYLGWGLVGVAVLVVAWRWRDPVVRIAAFVAAACALLALSPSRVRWAPWQWIAKLPVLENVLQRRILIFALIALAVVVARGVEAAARLGAKGMALAAVALAVVVVSFAVPEAGSLPLRTVAVSTPAWWRAAPSGGTVLSYPFPGDTIESPLSWQAASGFTVALVGGSGPGATPARAGRDEAATELLDDLSFPLLGHASTTPAAAALVRAMVRRDHVTAVVVPVEVHGPALTAGGTRSSAAAVFFAEILGVVPRIVHDAWVFSTTSALPAPRLVASSRALRCASTIASRPGTIGHCLGLRGAP